MKDISNESLREYTFYDGTQYRVHEPATLESVTMVDGSLGHRVTDARGRIHEIAPGWRTLCRHPKFEEKDTAR